MKRGFLHLLLSLSLFSSISYADWSCTESDSVGFYFQSKTGGMESTRYEPKVFSIVNRDNKYILRRDNFDFISNCEIHFDAVLVCHTNGITLQGSYFQLSINSGQFTFSTLGTWAYYTKEKSKIGVDSLLTSHGICHKILLKEPNS